ncbi:MAG TPA: hypothetical protein P5295_15605, partial [Spirochaetota bacterium]|nr:hypothetical protein [Spirochaetota bacterium]
PAMVKKITEITGQKPVIGGHSTGGLVCFTYLEGAYLDAAEVIKGRTAKTKYLPHVKVSDDLAKERNNSVKGFIALDPAVAPYLPSDLDNPLIWSVVGMPIALPLDTMMESMLVKSGSDDMTMSYMMNNLFDGLSDLGIKYSDSIWEYFDFFRTSLVDDYVIDYFVRYATANCYIRMLGQFADWGVFVHMREGYKNGPENAKKLTPKARADGDGYLYYEDHMINITAPILCLGSESDGMQITDRIKDLMMDVKTPHKLDIIEDIPNSGHADLPIGYTAPTMVFPVVSDWLDSL